jgi:AcrR family transcriptional regulator
MTPAQASGGPTLPVRRRGKDTQRERLLTGMITAANRDGYAAANVSSVIGQAKVSRPTFYEHFADRDQCFLQAANDVSDALMEQVRAALEELTSESPTLVAIETLVAFAGSRPGPARFLMSETLAGGPKTLDARDHSVVAIAALLDGANEQLEPDAVYPDLGSEVLIGSLYRLLASRLRRGERSLTAIQAELSGWVRLYERPAHAHRWRTNAAGVAPVLRSFTGAARMRAPRPLGPGRPRMAEAAVAENHRLRIMFATAELVQERGYTETTIADITKAAGVDGRVFYRLFADKQDAFSAIHELGFQQLMAATAGAFFAADVWPERMWEALGAITGWLEKNPTVAHLGFVESYAVGPGAVQRVEDSLIAFTIFLQEGYQHETPQDPPSRLALEAIVTSVFEVLYREVRRSNEPQIVDVLGQLIHLSLAPFLGPADSDRFIASKRGRSPDEA